ncbi:MAG: Ribonuclease HIII [Candidatus Anoxychlamydiales bacterium]|nr:Ribonuclease HIII [Candidatus Anoxychlamydiales bacterium]NGX40936.1 Ribonuclease HIII [Candidatus Anoxychlamydiales bacterium]HEU63927.1 ribonuclease HIII [Chlamydiota bacterium]
MKPATFTTKIDVNLGPKLKNDLEEKGFSLTNPPYTIFSAKKKGVTLVLYKSGSLVVQGKEKDEFIEFYLEPEILKTFSYTNPEAFISMTSRIGVDESGKGDFFGPLCVAGLYADEKGIKELISLNIRDSKKISDKSILDLANILKAKFKIAVVRIFPEKYNDLYLKFKNLNHLLAWAHTSVISELVEKTSCKNVIIDQFANKSVVESAVRRKSLAIHLEQKTGAEEDPIVAGASIIARAAFLKGLEELSSEYDQKLPKGASSFVIDIGRKIVEKHGPEALEKVAKLHFKTKEAILNGD